MSALSELQRLAASILTTLPGAVWPRARRLYAERRAGKTVRFTGSDLIDEILDDSLARLSKGYIQEEWWNELLQKIEHPIITPEFLRHPYVQNWLSRSQVQADLKILAREKILGEEAENQECQRRLRESYSEVSGEAEHLARGPIDVALAILGAGYFAGMTPGEKGIAGIVQAGIAVTRAVHEEILSAIEILPNILNLTGHDDIVGSAHSKTASDALRLILRRRGFSPGRSQIEIRALAQRVANGNLRFADKDTRAEVLHWAARLHASDLKTLPVAKAYLAELRILKEEFDARIIDALVLSTEGNLDAALRLLFEVGQADARAVIFSLLRNISGTKGALDWFYDQRQRRDVTFLNGRGWANVAVALVESNRWEESVEILEAAEIYCDEWPYLLFLEGGVNAALLLPQDLREDILESFPFTIVDRTLSGADAEKRRSRSDVCFARSAVFLEEAGEKDLLEMVTLWRIWLRLTDPISEVASAARLEVQEAMKDGKRAVYLLAMALEFKLPFDAEPINYYLRQRAQLGGLQGPELVSEFLLAKERLNPTEFAEYLEIEEERLSPAIPKAKLIGLRIEAYVKEGQTVRAKHFLEERKNELLQRDDERLGVIIHLAEGGDPRAQLESLYNDTKSLLDLKNLAIHVRQAKDWKALRPLLKELFRVEPTVENATVLIDCFQRDPTVDADTILTFFNNHSDVVNWSPDLMSAKAWALFQTGQLNEARVINDMLLLERHHSSDLHLDINLATQSGDWERFQVIVDREWDRRDGLDAHLLLRLASLAAEADLGAHRAYEFARLAVQKAPADPEILLNAYGLAVQLGREGIEVWRWFARAAELSSERGPVKRVDTGTLIKEMMPANRQRAFEINRKLLQGALPLHAAVSALNLPLSQVLINTPWRNARERDGRQRTIIPIISGARQPVTIDREWRVGLDITSLLVLGYLGILREAIESVKQIALAPDTMIFLLNERRRVRFHQPSRVKAAEEIRDLINRRMLVPIVSLPDLPEWLIEEVGRDLAELLHAARTKGGRVVVSKPIYKLRVYLETEADLREYGEVIVSTHAFVRLLRERGLLDSESFENANKYLSSRDRTENIQLDPALLEQTVFIDGLAVTYIQQAGILEKICQHGLNIKIHPSLSREQDELIAASSEGERLAAAFDEIRLILCDALEQKKATFLLKRGQEEIRNQGFETIAAFVEDAGPCDAICIDDRYFNRPSVLIDRMGRNVPLICVLDFLRHLEAVGMMNSKTRLNAIHRLREGGFSLIAPETNELEAHLRATPFDLTNGLSENAELRILRQTLMRVRGLGMIDPSVEIPFLEALGNSTLITLHRLWADNNLQLEHVVTLSDWIWQNISALPINWGPSFAESVRQDLLREASVRHLFLLLSVGAGITKERRPAFQKWVESIVFAPLLPANAELIDSLADKVRNRIEEIVERLGNDESGTDS